MAGREPPAPPDAYQKALGLLVRREHSRRELRRKLALKGAEPIQAEAALDRLQGEGFQDDGRFAVAFARTRAHAGYGPVRIRAELSCRGLDQERIEAALAACEADWPATARDLANRRYRPADLADPAKRRKAVEYLLRRGFGQADAYAALRPARLPGED